MQNLQISDTAETRIVPKRLFPLRFSDKLDIPPAVWCCTACSHLREMQQTAVYGEEEWILRSGMGKMGETAESISADRLPSADSHNPFENGWHHIKKKKTTQAVKTTPHIN